MMVVIFDGFGGGGARSLGGLMVLAVYNARVHTERERERERERENKIFN